MDLAVLNNVRILVVEDDEDDFFILKKIFESIPRSKFTLKWISTFEEAEKEIVKKNFDVYLIDYRLGAHTGFELLQIGKAEKRSEPFILLTGAGDPEIEWRSMQLAASDFLVKNALTQDTLVRAIYYALERKKNERQRLNELIELNRSKDEFISIASHQLRTPATAVKQYVGMLLEGFAGELTPDQSKLLKRAYESNDRQLTIVSDLLRVAQVDAGQVKLTKEKVDIVELVREVVRDMRDVTKKRHQKVKLAIDQPAIMLTLDVKSIRMAIENIVDNASKYSEDGKTIIINVMETNGGVTIAVADEGVGIQADQLKNLFEKFKRIPNSLSTERGGTGLGLYWAKQIIDLHGGRVEVSSSEGKGTIFRIILPKLIN